MAKKSKKMSSFTKYSWVAILILTVATIVMMFIPNIQFANPLGDPITVTGMQAAFGWKYTETLLGITTTLEITQFSILNALAYILPVVGLVLSMLFRKKNFLMTLITFALFVAGAVLAFLIPTGLVYVENLGGFADKFTAENAQLAVGAIVAGVLSILNALIVLAKQFVK